MICLNCNTQVVQVCQDEFCKACHVRLSFEDCTDGSWSAQMALRNGHSLEAVKNMYPRANV